MIYYIIWGIVAILAIVGCYEKQYRTISAILIIVIVTLFAGLRFERWSDWEGYFSLFSNAGNTTADVEYGFRLLCKIGKYVLRNYNIFLCVIYAVVFILHYLELNKSVPIMVTFCLLVFVSVSLLTSGGMRVFIASGITFYSIRYIREKKLVKFVVLVIIAALIHRTAIFFLPAFWIDKLDLYKKRLIIVTIVCIILGELGAFKFILTNIAPLFNRFPSFAYRIRLYAYSLDDFKMINFRFLKRTLILLLAIFVPLRDHQLIPGSSVLQKKTGIESVEILNQKIYINLFAVGYLLSILVPGQFGRVGGYYSVAEPVIEAIILINIKDSKNRTVLFFFFIFMYLANWVNTLSTFYPELLIPYKSVFFQ